MNDVTHVINYNLPDDAEDYVHQLEEQAGAGKIGVAITL